jgi:hypothetical protein
MIKKRKKIQVKEIFDTPKYEVKPTRSPYPGVDVFSFTNKNNDEYLILYSNNPPFQSSYYNGFKFKNYKLKVIQPDFGKFERGRLMQDITGDNDSINIYTTVANHIITRINEILNQPQEPNTILLMSVGARNIEPSKQKLYLKIIQKLIKNQNGIMLGQKEVSYAGYDLIMNMLIPKNTHEDLANKGILEEFISFLNLNSINESFISYLSKNLNISLSEAKLLDKEIKNYASFKKKKFKEIDLKSIKNALVIGTLSLSSLLSSLDASSDYFRMTSTVYDRINTNSLNSQQKIELLNYAKARLEKNDPQIKKIDEIISKLKNENKLNFNKKEKQLRLSNRRNKQQLEEVDWNKVKDYGKKAIATGLTTLMLTLPVTQSLYGDSCSIDSSGEVVSCDRDVLLSKKPVKDIISNIEIGIQNTKKYIYDKDAREFFPDEIQAAKDGVLKLQKRADATKEDKVKINQLLTKILQLEKEFNSIKRK